MQYIQQPQAIEAKSFDIIGEIIRETRPDYQFASPLHEAIIKRVIHTTADFDWLDILWFSSDVLEQFCAALSRSSGFIPTPRWRFPGSIKRCWQNSAVNAAVTSVTRGLCVRQKSRVLPGPWLLSTLR